MDSISHDSIIARQRDRILVRIDKANQLIDEYENILLSSENPKEKLRVEEGIQDTKQLLAKYQTELNSLVQVSGTQPVIRESSVVKVTPEGDEEPTINLDAQKEIPPSGDVQELDRRLRDLQRGIDDLKRGQGVLYKQITETRNQELGTVIAMIRQGAMEKTEMMQMLEMVGQAMSLLQENQESLSMDVRNAVAEVSSALSSEASLQGKLELTLPIIPLLLDYKVELTAANSADLLKVWENAQNWWKSLTMRSTERATQELINRYLEEFRAAEDYIAGFESKINQRSSNILIKAELEFDKIAKLALELGSDLELLNLTRKLTRSNLQRMEELAKSISNQAHSAAAAVASGGMPTTQIGRIKQNLPTLHQLIQDLITKLGA
jgi:hypothetical protein